MHQSMQRMHIASGMRRKKDIAEALGVSQSTVTNWGARGVSKEGALEAAKVWGVDANYILEGIPDDADTESGANLGVKKRENKRDGYIPLLSPLDINSYRDPENMECQPNEIAWRPKPSHLSDNAFIFVYSARAMEPVLLPFDHLYIETKIELSDLNDGDYVLVMEKGAGATAPMVRKLIFGDNRDDKLLITINKNLPARSEVSTSFDDYTLVGVVDSFTRHFRRKSPWY